MNDLLKKRMSATQQAAEIVVGDEAYETLFRGAPAPEASRFCDLPIERLRPFFTADIGFRPYPPEKLKAFSQQLAEQGIYERVIVRPISGSNDYEILAGHNRTKAWQMSGHDMIPAEVVSADDARAVSIAVATNLLRRQDLTIIERGKAYRALLRENNRHGQWDANQAETTFGDSRQKLQEGDTDSTFGENRQRYNARTELVLTMLAEASTRDISKASKPVGFDESVKVAKRGGNVANVARQQLEAETGQPVITSQNAVQLNAAVTEMIEASAQVVDRQDDSKSK